MNIPTTILDYVGNTPVVELKNIQTKYQLQNQIYAKLEMFNPMSSVKDRIAKHMILEAMKRNEINQDTVIIEPTSGNTGIGLAMVASSLGLSCILVMSEAMSMERRKLMKMLGAKLVLTEAKLGMKGAIAKAEILKKEIPNSFMPYQFGNRDNPLVHKLTTAQELLEVFGPSIDYFICGVGTGGTISGVGSVLKEHNPQVKIIAVEPKASPILSGGQPGPHGIQGIGAGFVPQTLDTTIYDEVFPVDLPDAIEKARMIAKTEGILIGISGGAALHATIEVAKRVDLQNKRIVTLFPDTGERYLSTALFPEQDE